MGRTHTRASRPSPFGAPATTNRARGVQHRTHNPSLRMRGVRREPSPLGAPAHKVRLRGGADSRESVWTITVRCACARHLRAKSKSYQSVLTVRRACAQRLTRRWGGLMRERPDHHRSVRLCTTFFESSEFDEHESGKSTITVRRACAQRLTRRWGGLTRERPNHHRSVRPQQQTAREVQRSRGSKPRTQSTN